jgi:hypothetical protein
MKRLKGNYWKVDEVTYKLQLKTRVEQREVQEYLPGWDCISFGYAPSTQEDILIFERKFKSEMDWTKFLNSDLTLETIELREV